MQKNSPSSQLMTLLPHLRDNLPVYATALVLARAGAHVVAVARTVGGLEALDDAIRTLGGHRRFRASEIRQFLEQVEDSDRI